MRLEQVVCFPLVSQVWNNPLVFFSHRKVSLLPCFVEARQVGGVLSSQTHVRDKQNNASVLSVSTDKWLIMSQWYTPLKDSLVLDHEGGLTFKVIAACEWEFWPSRNCQLFFIKHEAFLLSSFSCIWFRTMPNQLSRMEAESDGVPWPPRSLSAFVKQLLHPHTGEPLSRRWSFYHP